jgi:hypothetical protein
MDTADQGIGIIVQGIYILIQVVGGLGDDSSI